MRSKIYTKRGDKGYTSLFHNFPIAKNDPLIKSYGKIDTLISFLAFSKALIKKNFKKKSKLSHIVLIIEDIQLICFEAITDLASTKIQEKTKENFDYQPRINQKTIEKVEKYIDELWSELPELRNFVLPGEDPISSSLHIARAICREIEPLLVECEKLYPINPFILPLINRLSDLLFSLALKVELILNNKLSLLKNNKKIY